MTVENSNEDKKLEIIPQGSVQAGYIRLPYNEGEFRDFIKSLLGSPQSIGRQIEGVFEFTFEDINNMHSLLLQRISQQNQGTLIKFETKIIFSDNTTVSLNSIEEVLTYNEVRPIISETVYLIWDLLIQFPDKGYPEKQKIQVTVVSSGESVVGIDDEERIAARYLQRDYGYFNYRIEHTARSWGADIEALLYNHIKSIVKPKPQWKRYFRKNKNYINLVYALLIFSISVIGCFTALQQRVADERTAIEEIILSTNQNDLTALNKKIDSTLLLLTDGVRSQLLFAVVILMILSAILSLALASWFDDALKEIEPSFILLTKKSFQNKELVLKRQKNSIRAFIFTVAGSIILGVISNIVFVLIFGPS